MFVLSIPAVPMYTSQMTSLGISVQATAQAEKSRTQELYVADLDMTVDTGDESYADRPATTRQVPDPSALRFGQSPNGADENTAMVRGSKALQVHFLLLVALVSNCCSCVMLPAPRHPCLAGHSLTLIRRSAASSLSWVMMSSML